VLVDDPAAARSEHPTNSFVALGPLAEDIAGDHDETSTAFHPMRALIRHRGKMLLVGCMHTSPGFSTVHLAQEDLGLATRSVLSGLIGAHYYDHKRFGERRWFARADVPGCSMGFGKAYPQYEKAGLLAVGNVLAARSALIDAAAAYRVERAMLERDPTSLLCDEPACTFCATRTYNYRALPGYAVRVPKAIAKAAVLLARRWAR
jgi:aminoglycoside N3'-acetyltransferase